VDRSFEMHNLRGIENSMQIPLSDLADTCGQNLSLELNPSDEDAGNEIKFLKDFRKVLKKYNKPTEQVDYLLNKLGETMDTENIIQIFDIDENSIKKKIEKHPYFKNPCDYPIRLTTIMKYLKKKGVDISYKDMDLIVDRLIQEIDGVKKIDDGLYLRNK